MPGCGGGRCATGARWRRRDASRPTRCALPAGRPRAPGAGSRRRDPQLLGAGAGGQGGHGARAACSTCCSGATAARRAIAASAPSSAASSTRGWRCTWWRCRRTAFDALAARRRPRPARGAAATPVAERGRAAFRAQRCDACHTVRGVRRAAARRPRPHPRRQPPLPRRRHAAQRRRPALRAGSPTCSRSSRARACRRTTTSTATRCTRWRATWSAAVTTGSRGASDRGAAEPRCRAPPGELSRAASAPGEPPRGWRLPVERSTTPHRPVLHRHRAAVLRAGRRAGAADAHAARGAGQHAGRRRSTYNQLFTMHGTVMMFLFADAGGRGDRGLPAARHARRARPAVPAPVGLCLLGLRDRRPRLLLHALLRRRARRRLVHVPAAHRAASTRPASAPTAGCWASASSRSRRSPARSS